MSRSVEPEEGKCDSCNKECMVYDLMGDVYCGECLVIEKTEEEPEFYHPGLRAVYKYLISLGDSMEWEDDDLCDTLDLFAGWCRPELSIKLLDSEFHARQLTIQSANQIAAMIRERNDSKT